ncbi:MAG: radical SAM protein [Desulfobacteraceae bacterium]|nr:radical SAM protein [Desulfobacteraceae bacterium]
MHYEGRIIRPPSEANSILLQITVGCSHNKCTFCGTYKDKRFKIKPDENIMEDIDFAAQYCKNQNRVFICDGDALIVPQKRLLKYFLEIEKKLPWVERVGLYANTKGIGMKSAEELEELRKHGLGIVYMGLESGDDETLKAVNKGATAEKMIRMGRKIKDAGIKLSVTVLLGLAGKERSQEHAEATGRVLSEMDPDFVGALSLMITPGTPLNEEYKAGRFQLLNANEMLEELRTMLAHTDLSDGLFHANHASNYLPIRTKLPQDKEKTLKLIDDALAGKVTLRPEFLRAL